jgi:hypothetical protein
VLRLHVPPSLAAQSLVPRLLSDCPGLEVRIAPSAENTRRVAEESDADIVCDIPAFHGERTFQGVAMMPPGTERVAPLRTPNLAPAIRDAAATASRR